MIRDVIDFLDHDLKDPIARENWEKLRNFLNDRLIISSELKILEVEVKNPSADYIVTHLLGFKPKDVLITSNSSGTASVNFSKTTKSQISLNVSDPTTVRLLIGSFNL